MDDRLKKLPRQMCSSIWGMRKAIGKAGRVVIRAQIRRGALLSPGTDLDMIAEDKSVVLLLFATLHHLTQGVSGRV